MTGEAIDRGRSRGGVGSRPTAAGGWRGLAWRQYRLERKMFWRNPSAAFFNFLLPLLFLGFFGALLHELTGEALARGRRVDELSVTEPSLEDVYLELTAEEPADV